MKCDDLQEKVVMLRGKPLRVAKFGGRRSKSSVRKVNPWCFVVAENTPKIPRLQMVWCSLAHAHVPAVGDAVGDVC